MFKIPIYASLRSFATFSALFEEGKVRPPGARVFSPSSRWRRYAHPSMTFSPYWKGGKLVHAGHEALHFFRGIKLSDS